MRLLIFWFAAAMAFSGFGTTADAQSSQNVPVSDPDFEVQGEYSGPRHSMRVIALGEGEFRLVVTEGPIDAPSRAGKAPRQLEGDAETVAELTDALELERVVRQSPTLGAEPPAGALVLFDGTPESLDNWEDGRLSEEGFLVQGTQTKQNFGDYTLHLEFRTPWNPQAAPGVRGNSGVYHQGRYETQILDSFGLAGNPGHTGAIYSVKAPDVNAGLPPMRWQTYDVDFTAARYEGERKVADARLTVRLNGKTVQRDVPVPKATTSAILPEGPTPGPIYLQDHGAEVRFRNIWLLPRDAEREAARPIVPGFERFFAAAEDGQALGGELLVNALACTACHAADSAPSPGDALPSQRGPDLSAVGGRVRPDALVAMIADPHQAKTGTTMPDPWAGMDAGSRTQAAAAIASFLLLEGESSTLVDRPSRKSSIERGGELYHSVGCVACHQAFEGDAFPRATTVPLGDVARKYTVDSLAKFIAHPHDVRRGGRMPALVGSMADAFSIASYLTGSVTERENLARFERRIYKGDWSKLPDFESLEAVTQDQVQTLSLKGVKDLNQTGIVFQTELRIHTAGEYEFSIASDDGSRLHVGDHVLNNDGIHPTTTQTARWQLEAGTYPVRVEWFNGGGQVSLAVRVKSPVLGEFSLHELISDGLSGDEPLLASDFEPRPDLVGRGRELFRTSGCASCHDFGSEQPAAEAAPVLTDLRFDRGCLAETVTRPAVDFRLSPRQRRAIVTALQRRREVPADRREVADRDRVHVTLAGLNCYACHRRGKFGGPEPARDASFQTTTAEMGWEGRLPPLLDGVGDKLTDRYLAEVLSSGANERTYMLTRMPGFGEGHLEPLQAVLGRLDRQPAGVAQAAEHAKAPSADASLERLSDGRKLVGAGGLSCIKCHAYDGVKGGGLGMIDLLAMPQRLRRDWFVRYLQDPTQYRPGTRMPNSFPEGKSSYTKLYGGDPHQQIEAIWAYLAAGKTVKEPQGLRPGAILLTAAERPRIYRNFFEGVSGRGIAVGYPEEVNLIWDAERMALSFVWKSEFVDASQHWNGRGQGRIGPAGDQVQRLEAWTPLLAAESVETPWPDQSARELGYRFSGYRLDDQGNPAFRYQLGGFEVEDAIRPQGRDGFQRRLSIVPPVESGRGSGGLVWRIARGEAIDPRGDGFEVDGVRYSIDGADVQVVPVDGQRELRARLPTDRPVTVVEQIRW